MVAIQLSLWGDGADAPAPISSQVDWVDRLTEPEPFYFEADPCKACYLREWCSDECGRLGFNIDSRYAPRGTFAQWRAK